VPATPATDLSLVEVFSSIQGEGVLIGRRQLFVRLADCNLACDYCDTHYAAGPTWQAETAPGDEHLQEHPNPASSAELVRLVHAWQQQYPIHHSLALTGGEPLLQAGALAGWLPEASGILPVYLETNGTLPNLLAPLLPWLHWVSMDIKHFSTTGAPTPWEAHRDFLQMSGPRLCQVKLVIDAQTTREDLLEVARFIERHAPGAPLVLQPRTVAGRPSLVGRQLLRFQALAAGEHPATLVIPQLHPLLALR
jgi:organic radical activating enzyme